MSKRDSSSKNMVQQKLPELFSSTKRDRAVTEKDKPKKKLKQAAEENEAEEKQSVIVNEGEENSVVSTSTSVRQKSHVSKHQKILDDSEEETFEDQDDVEASVEEDDVPHETYSSNAESEPEELQKLRKKLTFHDEEYTSTDKFLHKFDMDYEFGPCIGLTRLERWERAQRLGLNPPMEVKDVLTPEAIKQNPKINESVFYGRV